jgi:hypothetical protein
MVSRSAVAVVDIAIDIGLRFALVDKAGLRAHRRDKPRRDVTHGEIGAKQCALETSSAPSKTASRNRMERAYVMRSEMTLCDCQQARRALAAP